MNSTTKALLGFLAGAAAGVITGILIAPDKGSVTREKLQNKAKDISHDISDAVHEKIQYMEEQIQKLKKEAEKKMENIKKTTEKTEEQKVAGN